MGLRKERPGHWPYSSALGIVIQVKFRETLFIDIRLINGRLVPLCVPAPVSMFFHKEDPIRCRFCYCKMEILQDVYKRQEVRYLKIKLLLNTPSKFILLDEPFSGVSPVMVEEIQKLILEKSPEKGILLSDHDYRNVLKITNRCCLIYQGSMKQISGKADLVRWGYILAG